MKRRENVEMQNSVTMYGKENKKVVIHIVVHEDVYGWYKDSNQQQEGTAGTYSYQRP